MFWLIDHVSSGVLGGVLVAVEGIDIKLPGKIFASPNSLVQGHRQKPEKIMKRKARQNLYTVIH